MYVCTPTPMHTSYTDNQHNVNQFQREDRSIRVPISIQKGHTNARNTCDDVAQWRGVEWEREKDGRQRREGNSFVILSPIELIAIM